MNSPGFKYQGGEVGALVQLGNSIDAMPLRTSLNENNASS
jgi:hypothetical protein